MTPEQVIRFKSEISSDDLDRFAERWREIHPGARAARLLTPLPRRVRLRLWLIDHDHADAARQLWRVCGMWVTPCRR